MRPRFYFMFQFFIRKFDISLCTTLIIRVKRILIIDMHKNAIRYKIECGLRYVRVTKKVNNSNSLLMICISLIEKNLINKIMVGTLFCLISILKSCCITYAHTYYVLILGFIFKNAEIPRM